MYCTSIHVHLLFPAKEMYNSISYKLCKTRLWNGCVCLAFSEYILILSPIAGNVNMGSAQTKWTIFQDTDNPNILTTHTS